VGLKCEIVQDIIIQLYYTIIPKIQPIPILSHIEPSFGDIKK